MFDVRVVGASIVPRSPRIQAETALPYSTENSEELCSRESISRGKIYRLELAPLPGSERRNSRVV